eukprot:CAMPEP_0181024072 /NCGR_PEP_ID=MMETSP1070-20121207/2378_1 /TAXON_ID=265543 /ORGANISM="Minutocellus polymorphus, Strain NH13" /LENGTH=342 /DNA_ID=CAMNT_0023101107 /DNA_START=30 /DNA_END=1055 /DNA_ORIENTATION=-
MVDCTESKERQRRRPVVTLAVRAQLVSFAVGLLFLATSWSNTSTHRSLREETNAAIPPQILPEVIEIVEDLVAPFLEDQNRIYEFDANDGDDRPAMHTFFAVQGGQNGTISQQDMETLAVWKHAWSKAGWKPRVLNIDHAQQYPRYDETIVRLKDVPMPENDDYNRFCYLRHFAMAAVGGGWMSDYDTVPINMTANAVDFAELPNEAKFTTYQNYIPALLVGSAEEWERIAESLVQEGIDSKENGRLRIANGNNLFSDMFAMEALVGKRQLITSEHKVGEATQLPISEKGCRYINKRQKAIHFSHHSVSRIGFHLGKCRCRAYVMAETLRELSTSCDYPDYI